MADTDQATCRECGNNKFWKINASEIAGEDGDHAQFLTSRAEALFEEAWLAAYVCRKCGVTVFRVANLKRFERLALNPETGIESIELPVPTGPFR